MSAPTNDRLATWRSWHEECPCPVCGGWRSAGRSAKQCNGGYFTGTPRRVRCSVTPSRVASRTGKTYIHDRPEPVVWVEPPEGALSLRGERRRDYSTDDAQGATWGSTGRTRSRPTAVPPGLANNPKTVTLSDGGLGFAHWRQVARWDYAFTDGRYCYSVVRFGVLHPQTGEPLRDSDGHVEKTYRQGVARGDGFDWHVDPEALVPYRLPQLVAGIAAGKPVVFVEGEKSCDLVAEHFPQYVATCNAGGALRFDKTPGWARSLAGARQCHVIIDRDASGRAWARSVLAVLRTLESRPTVACWQSATTGEGDDVIDHVEAGHRLADLVPVKVEDL